MAVVANLGEKNKDNWRGGLTLSINYPRPRLTPPASVGYWARELLAPVKGVVDTAVIHRRPLIRPAGRSAKGAWLFGIVLHSLLNPDRSLVAKVALSRNPSAMWASLFLYFFFLFFPSYLTIINSAAYSQNTHSVSRSAIVSDEGHSFILARVIG